MNATVTPTHPIGYIYFSVKQIASKYYRSVLKDQEVPLQWYLEVASAVSLGRGGLKDETVAARYDLRASKFEFETVEKS